MAGGTGGHVFPALAVADALRRQGVEVSWMGTRQGLEARLVPQAGYPVEWISVTGLRGKGLVNWLTAPGRLWRAIAEAREAMARVAPHAVLGMGGFASGPGGLAAWLAGRPLVIHEQNSIPGLTNRLLARLAQRVLAAFPNAFPNYPEAVCTGNPVRPEIAALPPPEERLAGREGPYHLLILGGSQGAAALNQGIPAALALLPAENRPQVLHQAGERHLEQTTMAYREAGVDGQVAAFLPDMAGAYHWADLVVCRAGALTVAELAAAGVASVLIPFPHAVDDHQTHNACFLVDQGAALLLPQEELTPRRLAGLLGNLGREPERRLAMARRARALAQPLATEEVACHLLAVMTSP